MRKPYDSFIFTHIPKCGGSSLRAMFYEAAKLSSIDESQIHIPGEGNIPSSKNLPNLTTEELNKIQQKKIKILADHSKYNTHVRHGLKKIENPFYFTVLRDPVDRFISHYNFFHFKLGYGGLKGKTLDELNPLRRTQLIQSLANLQISYIVGGIKRNNDISKAVCDRAIKILVSKFHSIGILEDLEKSIDLLYKKSPRWLTYPDIIPKRNVNKLNTKKILPNEQIIEEIKEANKLDYILYEFAQHLLNTKMQLIAD